jgi:hypothetical protein
LQVVACLIVGLGDEIAPARSKRPQNRNGFDDVQPSFALQARGVTGQAFARLAITLDGAEPPVLRRIEAPPAIRLDRLHRAFQAAMGWTNSQL